MEKFQKKGAKIVLSGKTEESPYETGWELAQLVEQLIFNLRVTGLNPVLLIQPSQHKLAFYFALKGGEEMW